MDVYTSAIAKITKVIGKLLIVLFAADQFSDIIIKCLHTDFELQCSGRKLRDQRSQILWQAIGNHFEVQKQTRYESIEKELQNLTTDPQVQIEGPIHKLKLLRAALKQLLHRR